MILAFFLTWYPVYIIKTDTARADIVAPTPVSALSFPAKGYMLDHVWNVSGTKPTHRSAAFLVPTLAQWKEGAAACPPTQQPSIHYGETFDLNSPLQNRDNPAYLPSWNLYHNFLITQTTFVWYYQALTLSAAVTQAKSDWIDHGVYALGRPLSQDEMDRWTTGDPLLEVPIPFKPWQALMNCLCEPGESFTYVSTTPFALKPPYPCRYPVVPVSGAYAALHR